MAALDLQEQEQLDALKAWWKENGNKLLGVLLALVVAMGVWRGWQYYQHRQASEAATLFAEFVKQLGSNDAKRVNDAATMVMEKYATSGYAPRAALWAAQVNEQGKDTARARTQLQWVIDHSGEDGLKDVARLRLAAVLLDEKKYDDALRLLGDKHPASFDGMYADLRGDILSAQGKKDEARSAYKLAYEKTDAKSMYRNLIEMKLDALGEAK
ncbi:tetratricopeptide repeat protein [Candidatus Ferrigenium straubiae]|jgi:predicted negative regulator of RcsB-dependent stress response|uniref:tetratricopeptide repeat protein n=1 Tax=Candidatus Ferrigenium straubiae TaxID=2919506 RepID=UPI003F4A9EFB